MAARTLTLSRDAATGRKLGDYEIVSRLGSGGMAEIFLALHRGAGGFKKLVVLKKVLPDVKAEEEAVQMFLDEAKITAAFTHPNIAHVYHLDETEEGELFLAMEFIPGADLVEIAKACADAQEPIPTGFTLTAVRDCAHALHYAHTFTDPMGRPRPTIHRDVAEKNIMVTYDGITKLLDFGIAKAQGRATRTAAGMVKGTSGYMAPEQVKGEPLDARADVFSLGVVLHEMLTGSRLFYGNDPTSELLAVLDMEVWAPSERNAEVTRELDQVVFKALAKDRNQRFGSALEFARAIERVARDLMWDQEQCGALVARHFADRREQTRALLAEANAGEKTGYVRPQRAAAGKKPAEKPPEEHKVVRANPLVSAPTGRASGPKPGMRGARPNGVSGPKQPPGPAPDEKTVTQLSGVDPMETTDETLPPRGDFGAEAPVEKTVLRPPRAAPRRPHAPPPPPPNPFAEVDATMPGERTAPPRREPMRRDPAMRRDTDETPTRKKSRTGLIIAVVVALVAAGAAAGWFYFHQQQGSSGAPPPRIEF